jgi:hypothetical protein
MFYALLILPHLLALVGLGVYAYRTSPAQPSDGWDDNPWEPPPGGPEPPSGGPPLVDASAPRRRLRVGERLPALYPRPSRREHEREEPVRPRG